MGIGNRRNQAQLAMVPQVRGPRSQFDRSFGVKDTMDFDDLVPIFVDEVLPGDTMSVNLNCFIRLATQLVPIMDNLYVDFFWFYVPSRLVWTNFEAMMGGKDDPDDVTDYICPQMTFAAGKPEVGDIYDKFGLPTDIAAGYTIKNTLPFRCYYQIWNDWFRDPTLQAKLTIPVDDGPDVYADFALQKRNKKRDYFMASLPYPQRGPELQIPMATEAPVLGIGKFNQNFPSGAVTVYESDNTSTGYTHGGAINVGLGADGSYYVEGGAATNSYPNIRVELGSYAGTINELREAFALQELFEMDMRGGARFTEILLAHFDVVSPDARLQRAEFLGSGQTRINVHPVAQQAPTSGSNYFGQLGAFGTAAGGAGGFSKSFVEHGYVIGLACARADVTYQTGVERMWNRSTRYDFFWPLLENLGEQAVLNKEIYVQGNGDDENVFGYQEQYADYKYKPSQIHGQFRSSYSSSLDKWHMAEDISELPTLAELIVAFTPIERAMADTNAPHLLCDYWFNFKHARRMRVRSTPMGLARF